ncbi:MAG: cadherin-like domain-containing protein [Saprospiraceae bacterium]|nr:cadherin-like domain-containing protein [Saprospiraceae bacterium]
MNVFKHKLFLFYFIILLGLPSALSAQVQSIRADIYQGEQYDQHIVNSVVLPAFITKQSTNGKASWMETGATTGRPGFNTLLYTPNAGFVGRDTIKVTYYRQAALATSQDVIVTVLRSEVTAVDDFEETKQNQAVTINVLANDFLTNGILKVKEILVANQATNVTINVDGTITYFPVAGFSGVANLSYLVCNEINICDVATVSIAVENSTPNRIDTLSIITTKNTTVPVLLPIEGYTLSQSPSKGNLDDSADVVIIFQTLTR